MDYNDGVVLIGRNAKIDLPFSDKRRLDQFKYDGHIFVRRLIQ